MSSVVSARPANSGSGPSTLIKDHLAGGASRLATLLLSQILPVFSVVAPCHPGAALRDLVLVQRGRTTSRPTPRSPCAASKENRNPIALSYQCCSSKLTAES